MRKTKQDTEISKLRILLAAEEEFCRHGYASANIEAIARATGMTKGAIFWHYENKANLFRAVIKRAIDRLRQLTTEVFESPRPSLPMEKCREIVKRLRKDKSFEVLLTMSDAERAGEMPEALSNEFTMEIARFSKESMRFLEEAKKRGELLKETSIPGILLTLEVVFTGVAKLKQLKATFLPGVDNVDDETILDILFKGLFSFQKK
jgi:TetR/AcrR family transcriptional regulator, repressor of the mexAB-oprM multidrug resistance operon